MMKVFLTSIIFIFLLLILHCKVMIGKNISEKPCHIMNITKNGVVTISSAKSDIIIKNGPRTGYLHGIGELDEMTVVKLRKFISNKVGKSQITGSFKKNSMIIINYYLRDNTGHITIHSLNDDFTEYLASSSNKPMPHR